MAFTHEETALTCKLVLNKTTILLRTSSPQKVLMRFPSYMNNTINVGANLIAQKGGKFPVIETLHNGSLISGHLLCQSVYVFPFIVQLGKVTLGSR